MENTVNKKRNIRPFGKRDVIGYFFGDFGCNMSFSLQAAWLFIFYTQYIGIRLEHWAIIILVAKLMDGINDPIAGFVIDKLGVNKDGNKFKPWIKYAGPILAAVPILMFVDSSEWSYAVRIIICFVSYFSWDLAYTLVNVPYGALSSVMTTNPVERTKLSTARSYGSILGNALLTALIPIFAYSTIEMEGNAVSVFVGENMFIIAIILGVVALSCFAILYFNVEERVVVQEVEVVDSEGNKSKDNNFFDTLKSLAKNRPFWGLIVAAIGQILFMQGAQSQLYQLTLQMYYQDGSLGSYITLIQVIPILVGGIFGSALVAKYGKQEVSTNPIFVSMIIAAIMYFIPIENPYLYLGLLILASTFAFGQALYIWAMVSDTIDYQEHITGNRNEGTIYSLYSMGRKIMQGFSSYLIPVAMVAVAPTLLADDPSTWTLQNSLAIKDLSLIFTFLGFLFTFIGLKFVYNLNKAKLAEMNSALNLRRNGAVEIEAEAEELGSEDLEATNG